jgi:hypothetical protein
MAEAAKDNLNVENQTPLITTRSGYDVLFGVF